MYAELQVTTNYSFLRSGSHPGELALQAVELGHTAIGIADRNTLAGVVRAYAAIKEYYEEHPTPPRKQRIKLLVGARLETRDGYSLLAYPTDLDAYKRLSRLLTVGNRRAAKGECDLTFDDLAAYAEGILAIVLPPRRARGSGLPRAAARARPPVRRPLLPRRHHAVPRRRCAPPRLARQSRRRDGRGPGRHQRRALSRARAAGAARRGDGDPARLHRRRAGLPPLRQRRAASQARPRRWRGCSAAIRAPSSARRRSSSRCRFTLDQLTYQYPVEYEGGETPMEKLERLTWKGAAWRYPEGVPEEVANTIRHEFDLIAQQGDRALLPDRARDRHAGAQDGHPLPGPRLGRQFRRLLLPRHHRGRIPTRSRGPVRALPVQRARRAARHRRRFRARAARGDHPVDLQREGPHARRAGRHGDRLPEPQRHPRGRQGARPVARHGGRHGRHGVGHGLGRRRCRPCARGGPRSHRSAPDAGARTVGRRCAASRAISRSMSAASC